MRSGLFALALVPAVAGLALASPGAPAEAPPGSEATAPAPPAAGVPGLPEGLLIPDPGGEQTFQALSDSLEALAREALESGADEIVLLEVEEIAIIAEEILVEGDAETANELLEDAIALLDPKTEE